MNMGFNKFSCLYVAFSGPGRPVSPMLSYYNAGTSCFLIQWTILPNSETCKSHASILQCGHIMLSHAMDHSPKQGTIKFVNYSETYFLITYYH